MGGTAWVSNSKSTSGYCSKKKKKKKKKKNFLEFLEATGKASVSLGGKDSSEFLKA